MKINKEEDRGKGFFGWLKANYSFSFSSYFNPQKMGFESLRVINEDFIAPGAGFPTHSHNNMEILTIILKGKLAHKDSLGNVAYLEPGRIQRMYAGKTISHSEYNASESEELNLMQIWIQPNQFNLPAEYNEKDFDYDHKGVQLLASPNGDKGSIKIYQNINVELGLLQAGESLELSFPKEKYYIHIISGEVKINNNDLTYGDSIEGKFEILNIAASKDSRILIFRFLQ